MSPNDNSICRQFKQTLAVHEYKHYFILVYFVRCVCKMYVYYNNTRRNSEQKRSKRTDVIHIQNIRLEFASIIITRIVHIFSVINIPMSNVSMCVFLCEWCTFADDIVIVSWFSLIFIKCFFLSRLRFALNTYVYSI